MKRIISVFLIMVLLFSMGVTSAIPASAEVGNDYVDAKKIQTNKAYSESIFSDTDKDYYKFTLSSAGNVSLNFKHKNLFDSNSFWTASLINSQTQVINSWDFSGTNENETTNKVGLDKGTYYICIQGAEWNTWFNESDRWNDAVYTFKLNYTKTAVWEREFNEDYQTANRIVTGKSYAGTIKDAADLDFYKFTLKSAGCISFLFKHKNLRDQNSFWTLTLINSSTSEIVNYDFSGTKTSVTTAKMGLPAGTYYIRLRGADWSSWHNKSNRWNNVPYTFKVNYTKTAVWEREFNDDYESANKIVLEKTYSGTTRTNTDQDYYRFTLPSKTKIKITFTQKKQKSTASYYDFHLYDNETNLVYEAGIPGNKTTITKTVVLGKGTYFVRVRGGDWSSWHNISYRWSDSTYRFKLNEILDIPDDITVKQTTNTVTLKWNKVSGANGYNVYQYNTKTKTYKKLITTKKLSYTVKKLKVGTNYKFMVKAYKSKSTGTIYSSGGVVTTTTKPSTATLTSVTAGTRKLTVKWKKNSTAAGYQITYATNKNFKNAKITYAGKNNTYKVLKSLAKGKTYFVRIRAYRVVNGKRIYGNYSVIKYKKTR